MKLLKLMAAAALSLLMASCSESPKQDNITNNPDTAVLKSSDEPSPTAKAGDEWAAVDWNSPVLKYEEVTNKDISVRGSDNYGIYGLGENVLFETGKAAIRKDAENNLKEVAASINKRYANGKVKVYGFTDATGSEDANKPLSRQRAEAVKNWLVSNGNIDAGRIVVYAEGESRPVADNDNAAGREQNRRVEIVARR
jgi:outer membrane protein OmpA-like peptidoglycan-associated protein